MSHFCLTHPSITKIKEKKKKRNINNDLAVLPSHDRDTTMFASEKGMNGKWHLLQDKASLRQLLCILGSLIHQRHFKV